MIGAGDRLGGSATLFQNNFVGKTVVIDTGAVVTKDDPTGVPFGWIPGAWA